MTRTRDIRPGGRPPGGVPGARTGLARRLAAALVLCALACAPPNVVIVITDDQAFWSLDLMPQTSARLAGEGMTFTTAVATTSLCCPSRATLLSGAYPSSHGIRTLGGAPTFDASDTVATRLEAAGYTTALFGKYMNENRKLSPRVPPGWNEWRTFADRYLDYLQEDSLYFTYKLNENGTLVRYGDADEDYSTDVLARFAVGFIEGAPEPFFLYLAFWAPHDRAVPARRHRGVFSGLELPQNPNRWEADVADKPPMVQQNKALGEHAPFIMKGTWLEYYRASMESLLAVDEAVARLLDALAARRIDRRTLVIFTSDNGMMYGSHWNLTKVWPYEESILVPLVMRWPGRIAPGTTEPAIVGNVDIAATICDVAGVSAPARNEGVSLRPLFTGGSIARQHLFLESPIPAPGSPWVGVRDVAWKYVGYDDGFEELYDLRSDPAELDNLVVTAGVDAHRATLEHYRSLVAQHRARSTGNGGGDRAAR